MGRTGSSSKVVLAVLLGASMTLGACKHYRVTDLSSGSTYYTKKVHHKDGGAVSFRDVRTDTKVTVQSSEVDRITKSEFKQATKDDENSAMTNQ